MTAKTNAWYAESYVKNFGFHLVPIEPGRKFPTAKDWGNLVLDDANGAASYYEDHPEWNIGLALGPSGYCSLDIDCEESTQTVLSEMGIDPKELDKYPTIQGREKGRRLLFRVPSDTHLPYAKLNWPHPDDPDGSKHRDLIRRASEAKASGDAEEEARLREEAKALGNYTVLELRAATDGKQRQDVLPPSMHPDTGRPYKWIVQPAKSHEEWPEPPDWLLVMWTQWDRFKPQLKSACPWAVDEDPPKPLKPKQAQDPGGINVIEEHLSRVTLPEALERYGYKRVGRRYLSPHTTTGLPGVTVLPNGTSCYIHHASDPLCSEESGRPVNAFDLYCEYECGGDVSKAVKSLAKEYGIKRERPVPNPMAEDAPPPPPSDDDLMPPSLVDPEPVQEAEEPKGRPFKPLGYDGDHYYYLPRGTEQVLPMRRGSHTSPAEMMGLATYEWWQAHYPKGDSGIDWQLAASDCMRSCENRGVYSLNNVRGRGAWYDEGASVLHLGDRMIVDGEVSSISDHHSRYIYTRQSPVESTINSVPASDADAKKVFDIVCGLNWSKPVHGWITAGFLALAPVCGALAWRPHIWLTAQRGAGKSWLQDHIAAPLLGQSALIVQGGTTEAGIRQHIKQDARPIVFDEAEAENQRGQQRMQGVIELARQSSSESSAEIIKGTSGGGGMAFRMRSMFMLGSVNVSLVQAADESRFTVVSLEPPKKSPGEVERFHEFAAHVDATLSKEFCASIRARTYRLIPTIRENAATMAQAVAEVLGNQRIGDQFGTLLAGAVSLYRGDLIDIEEARRWVGQIDLSDAREQEQASDEESCLNAILQTQIKVDAASGIYVRTIAEVIECASGRRPMGRVDPSESNSVLARHGLQVDGEMLCISNTHAELAKLLRDTAWAAGWKRVLSRLPGAEACPSPMRFAGVQSRVVRVPIKSFLC